MYEDDFYEELSVDIDKRTNIITALEKIVNAFEHSHGEQTKDICSPQADNETANKLGLSQKQKNI